MLQPIEFQVTVDCADPHELAAWWAETLHWELEPTNEEFIRQMVAQGHATEAETRQWRGQLWWAAGAAIGLPGSSMRCCTSVNTPPMLAVCTLNAE